MHNYSNKKFWYLKKRAGTSNDKLGTAVCTAMSMSKTGIAICTLSI